MTARKITPVFKIGDIVEWESQANGNVRIKMAVVVGIVPAKTSLAFIPYFKSFNFKSYGSERNHESYVVAEVHPHRKTKFFWPVVHNLKKANRFLPAILPKKNMTLKPSI